MLNTFSSSRSPRALAIDGIPAFVVDKVKFQRERYEPETMTDSKGIAAAGVGPIDGWLVKFPQLDSPTRIFYKIQGCITITMVFFGMSNDDNW